MLIADKRESGWPYWRCADYLNHIGHATFSGKPWSIGRLSQIAPRGRTAETIFATEDRLGCDLTNSL